MKPLVHDRAKTALGRFGFTLRSRRAKKSILYNISGAIERASSKSVSGKPYCTELSLDLAKRSCRNVRMLLSLQSRIRGTTKVLLMLSNWTMDEIDRILVRHYEYSIRYDIKYRMGKDADDEDGDK